MKSSARLRARGLLLLLGMVFSTPAIAVRKAGRSESSTAPTGSTSSTAPTSSTSSSSSSSSSSSPVGPILIRGIECPTLDPSQRDTPEVRAEQQMEMVRIIVHILTDGYLKVSANDFDEVGNANPCTYDPAAKINKHFMPDGKLKDKPDVLVLGAEDSNFREAAVRARARDYATMNSDLMPGSGKTKLDRLRSTLGGSSEKIKFEMIYGAREIHFLLKGSYPEISEPKEKIQKMVTNGPTGRYITDWEMWFLHCSVYAPLLLNKLSFH
jgi:hypothetical protein